MLILIAVSLTAAAAGFSRVLAFDLTPGQQDTAPTLWPGPAGIDGGIKPAIQGNGGRSSLILFAHPFCSCTHATISEIARVLNRHSRKDLPAIHVLFSRPESVSRWKPGALWVEAAALPGSSVSWDDGGRAAGQFGVRTSGTVLLYDARGVLRFAGGVTGSRGHAGDNFGSAALARALDGGKPAMRRFLVFGCSLGEFRK
jgi:hypothetical protein